MTRFTASAAILMLGSVGSVAAQSPTIGATPRDTLAGFTTDLREVAFSPDSALLAATSVDGGSRRRRWMWAAPRRRPVGVSSGWRHT